jgi:mRNA interferase MazF
MVVPSVGEVILVPFPFSDLSQAKLRPAVCLAAAGRGDWVLCQVTSNSYGDPSAIPLNADDFAAGGLRVASFARPGKPFTANSNLMVRSVGLLAPAALDRVLDAVASIFRPNAVGN